MPFIFKKFTRFIFVSLATIPLLANATDSDDFALCVDKIKGQARSAGYSDFIVNDVVPTLSPIKRVIELDQRQPEFSQSFADYLKLRLTNFHIETGRKK